MGRYIDGKPYLRPEPGRLVGQNVKNITINKGVDIDIVALANAVAQAIEIKIPQTVIEKKNIDTFDTKSSLSKLADVMVIQRENTESNFEDLGKIKKTKKDIKETNKTIDLLSELGD